MSCVSLLFHFLLLYKKAVHSLRALHTFWVCNPEHCQFIVDFSLCLVSTGSFPAVYSTAFTVLVSLHMLLDNFHILLLPPTPVLKLMCKYIRHISRAESQQGSHPEFPWAAMRKGELSSYKIFVGGISHSFFFL